MKAWTLGIVGIVAALVIVKYSGLCTGSSCKTNATSTTASVLGSQSGGASNTSEAGLFVPIEQALSTARTQHKLVMVDVYTDWCVWCKRLDHDVYPSPAVQTALKTYFAATKINAESQDLHAFEGKEVTGRQLANTWNVTGYPTILFLDSNGSVIESIPGYVPPKDFAQILTYMGTHAYERESFDTWQKQQG